MDRVGSVLGLLINPWARAVLHSQTDRLSPVPAPVTGARSNKPLQRDRASRNVRFRTRGSEKKSKRERQRSRRRKRLVYICVCVCVLHSQNMEEGEGCLAFWSAAGLRPYLDLTHSSTSFFFSFFSIRSRVKLF